MAVLPSAVVFAYHFLAGRARVLWLRGKALERYQLRRARKVVAYAVAHAAYFRERYLGCDLDDVLNLPTTDKKAMMKNLSDYNTLGLTKSEIIDFCLEVEKTRDFSRRLAGATVAMSSGTSGTKGVEILAPDEETFLRALFLSRFPLPRNEKLNLAFILRVSAPAVSLDALGHKLTYVSQLATLEEIRDALAALQPNAISAPPSMLHILAKDARAGRLSIRPKILISYAEVLHPDVRAFLSDTFDCRVDEIYKATEGAIAVSCRRGSLHINEDVVIVQLYDREGNPTPPGEPSHRMVVTDLFKRSQPIIRYELNDILTIRAEACPCGSGFRVIERVQGRSDDLFWGRKATGKGLQFIFPDYISRAIISSSEDIEEYQAVQLSPEEVRVRILPTTDADREDLTAGVESNLKGVFSAYQCKAPVIRVAFEEPAPNPNSLKLMRIHRAFEVSEAQIQGSTL